MKKLKLIFILIVLFSVSSCVTKRKHGSWQEYPAVPFFCRYQVADVSVIIDHVREENIAKQLFIIAETHLEANQNYARQSDKTLLLDITVEQRSFMQNVELYNSIYVSCIARDEDGNMYAKENEYISGKQTFVASAEQNIIISRILNRLINQQKKRNRDILKYEKQTAKAK
ncbi:hypothetical protein AGMMS50293_29720 [Spirochaetia bacterium]|nr:hypothetical protein AGMMS50293_29720 [Spirochaetia bacterium]